MVSTDQNIEYDEAMNKFYDSEVFEKLVDKETGLFLQTTETEIITERDYEFYNVEDSIFIEPDISQYTLK